MKNYLLLLLAAAALMAACGKENNTPELEPDVDVTPYKEGIVGYWVKYADLDKDGKIIRTYDTASNVGNNISYFYERVYYYGGNGNRYNHDRGTISDRYTYSIFAKGSIVRIQYGTNQVKYSLVSIPDRLLDIRYIDEGTSHGSIQRYVRTSMTFPIPE